MKIFKFLLLAVLSLSCAGDVSPQVKNHKTLKNKTIKPDVQTKVETADVESIAGGATTSVEKPFIFIARSPETYGQLQKMIENLPASPKINFEKTAVVAAFAGVKNTGGFTVTIKKAADKIVVDLIAPPKDAMVTQALTMPFEVALVNVEPESGLPVEFAANWKSAVQTYKVSKGEFEFSGGFTGRAQKFGAEGTIQILNYKDFATLVFNLSGKGAEKARKLFDAASGNSKQGKIELARLDAGSFSEGPKPPVKVTGTAAKNKISLTFEPHQSTVADGYELRGTAEIVKSEK